MTASTGDIIKSCGRTFGIEAIPYYRVYVDSAETKYINMAGLMRPALSTFTLVIQAVGASVTPSVSLYVPTSAREDAATFPWMALAPIASNDILHVDPMVAFYLKLQFSGKGYAIVTYV